MSRRFVFVFAGILLAGWMAGAVAGPNPDAQKIDACLKATREKGVSQTACIGIIADPCIATAIKTNDFIKGSVACAARELPIWTARLQRAIPGVKAGGKEVASAVAASQKSFTDSLAKLCPVYDKVDPDMARGGATYCRLQETAMRAILIERLSDAVNPH
jgi:hypothetical protein